MLGGRVKTLHPRVHAAILARRDHADDIAALDEHDIEPFDLVCVNLYPFERSRRGAAWREEEVVEMIDIGGPAMLRARGEELRPRRARLPPERYERGARGAARARRALARDAPRGSRPRRSRHRGVRGRDRELVRRPRALPETLDPRVREGARARLRREPAPARRLLRRARRAPPPPLAGRAAARAASSRSTTSTTLAARACCCASSTLRPA